MLVIDDSKKNFLNMKAKMLELSAGDFEENLTDYRRTALEIDWECYQSIVDKIKNTDYNHLSLEEQIKFYTEIVDDYNQLNELQCDYRNVYTKYSDGQELALSNLDNIFIDAIKNRISQIEGYLMNTKNLKSNKIELGRLNKELIDATKQKNSVREKIFNIRRRLKDDIINGGIGEEFNISSELKKYGIELKEIINDMDLLDRVYGDRKKQRDDAEEVLNLALILPNRDDAICQLYASQLLRNNYVFNLVELVKEIYTDQDDYDLFKDSLYKIADLVKEIKNGLRELNGRINNSFDYIKIKNYIEIFEKTKDYATDIDNITKTMTYLSEMIDNMEKKNNELLLSINKELVMLTENINTIYMDISKEEEHEDESKSDIFKLLHLEDVKDNQVIKLADIKSNFNISRVIEKTRGVINRVYGMFFSGNKNRDVGSVPELVIEKKENMPSLENPTANYEKRNVNIEFNEMEPFVAPQLFDDRKDSSIFDNKNDDKMLIDFSNDMPINNFIKQVKDREDVTNEEEVKMPELFWTPKEENNTSLSLPRAKSFDEQLEESMNSNNHLRR